MTTLEQILEANQSNLNGFQVGTYTVDNGVSVLKISDKMYAASGTDNKINRYKDTTLTTSTNQQQQQQPNQQQQPQPNQQQQPQQQPGNNISQLEKTWNTILTKLSTGTLQGPDLDDYLDSFNANDLLLPKGDVSLANGFDAQTMDKSDTGLQTLFNPLEKYFRVKFDNSLNTDVGMRMGLNPAGQSILDYDYIKKKINF
jgi:hypothetical protein